MPNMPSLCKMTWRACCPPTACPLIGHCTTAVQHTATHCNTLQHTVKHCNTLQHTATHLRCTTKRMHQFADGARLFEHRKTCPSHTHNTLNTLQHTATHCNTLQHTVIQCPSDAHNQGKCAYGSFQCECYIPEIYQIQTLKSRGTNTNETKISISICTARY